MAVIKPLEGGLSWYPQTHLKNDVRARMSEDA